MEQFSAFGPTARPGAGATPDIPATTGLRADGLPTDRRQPGPSPGSDGSRSYFAHSADIVVLPRRRPWWQRLLRRN